MSNIINVTPDESGRVIIELYGKKIEIHDSMFDAKGVAKIKQFGQDYEVHKPISKTQERKEAVMKKTTKKTQKVETFDEN